MACSLVAYDAHVGEAQSNKIGCDLYRWRRSLGVIPGAPGRHLQSPVSGPRSTYRVARRDVRKWLFSGIALQKARLSHSHGCSLGDHPAGLL